MYGNSYILGRPLLSRMLKIAIDVLASGFPNNLSVLWIRVRIIQNKTISGLSAVCI